MKIMKKAAFLACLCCTLFSCSNVEKKAGEKLQAAREAFERGDYSEAKIQIDSIKILYPKAFETRREGIGLMQQVELKEQEKTKRGGCHQEELYFRKRCRISKNRQLPASLTSNRKEPAPLLPALSGR